MQRENRNEDVKSTYKSNETEEWLDRVFTRPIGYMWARLFARLGVHPNTVTMLSIFIGVSSAFFFSHGSYRTEGPSGLAYNIIGVLLMIWANFYDSADGQLARMTAKTTSLGRILDGAASTIIFVTIYLAIVWRCYQHLDLEFMWLGIAHKESSAAAYTLIILSVSLFSGFVCHSGQCRLADYYRQIHLFFLKGEAGSELSSSTQQRALYNAMPWHGHLIEKSFLKTYVNYMRQQEKTTPAFQRFITTVREKFHTVDNIPQSLRNEFHQHSLPLIPLTNILTFNTRAIVLYVSCLIDIPWLYFGFEIIVMSGLCEFMRRRHEHMCEELIAKATA